MIVTLVRHAEADWFAAGSVGAVEDPELTDRGKRQAELLGRYLQLGETACVNSSPLTRALQTCQIAAPQAQVTVCDWLREIRYPNWRATPQAEVARSLSAQETKPERVQWDGLVGGESVRSYTNFVRAGLETYLEGFGLYRAAEDNPALWSGAPPDVVLVLIGHVGSLSVVLADLLGIASVPWERQRFYVPKSSVTIVETMSVGSHNAFGIRQYGDTSFLNA